MKKFILIGLGLLLIGIVPNSAVSAQSSVQTYNTNTNTHDINSNNTHTITSANTNTEVPTGCSYGGDYSPDAYVKVELSDTKFLLLKCSSNVRGFYWEDVDLTDLEVLDTATIR